ncbi:tyrosine-type recombinase/integrase [Lacisediminihabitans sp.]|jgi:integrase|uniref:tyrosine-type recombinase/integrase n=1 Tax=Lacisediminihabitans sp. TaxID=2787631 RepID=UPI002F951B74
MVEQRRVQLEELAALDAALEIPMTPNKSGERVEVPLKPKRLSPVVKSANLKAGAVLRNRTFRRGWFNDAAESVGIPGLTPHELRHTCASLAVSAGANVKALQRMLGHSSAKETLDTYSDLFDDDLDGVAVALNDTAARLNVGKLWAMKSARTAM